MLTIKQIRIELRDRNLQKVADAMEVSRAHIQAIRSGKGLPSCELHERLSTYFLEPKK